jgi:alpha-L-rhamnosidase
VAYRIASQKNLPSWGWWIEQGATTLWEQWNGSESRNHIMFGDINAWFYKALAGINPDPAAPAFKHFVIKPNVVGGLTSAEANYDSVRGRIASDWEIERGRFKLTVKVPANATATISVPTSDPSAVLEGGQSAMKAEGVMDFRVQAGRALFEVGSGTYHFTAPL